MFPLPARPGTARSCRLGGGGHLRARLAFCDPQSEWIGNQSALSPSAGELFRRTHAPIHAQPCRAGAIFGREHGARTGYYRQWGRLILCGRRGSGMNSLTAVSEVEERAPRVLARFGRADGDRAFRAAVRHSRHVRVLRLAIPLTAAVVLLATAALSFLFKPLRMLSGMPVDVGRMVVSGTKIMMHQPRLAGVTRDNRHYDMVAQAAAQDVTKPDMVELQGVHATMEMRDKVTFETTAKGRFYNTNTEKLTPTQNVVVPSSSGYQAFLNEAVVDVRASKIVSEKPVEVKTATWTISANRMEVSEAGDLVRFDRGVFVTLVLDSTTSGAGGGARKQWEAGEAGCRTRGLRARGCPLPVRFGQRTRVRRRIKIRKIKVYPTRCRASRRTATSR